jgi:hypothetical protein
MLVSFEQEQWANGGDLLPRHGHVPFKERGCPDQITSVTESPRRLPFPSTNFFRKVSPNVLQDKTGSSWQ